ncbi:type II restriction endonuclease [Pantoea sp. Cy-640]|jgi:hypothetical protein|uniref:type II restriction endonuclease n=1 Tax=Pantoea sp. Cy-640 TaxID=2608353 RepID=UPI00141A1E38|nr:type II restriction endonuclease [Pantoea sp. Cy-640]NIG16635.1 type II restriction endonuclease [Pantoea sp. Cy-640]
MKTQSLECACIKSLYKSEIYDQREFNGVKALKLMLGSDAKEFKANFFIGGEDTPYKVSVTWYDARIAHEIRSEFRFYYEANPVMDSATIGDNIVIGFDRKNVLTCILYKINNSEHQGNIQEWVKIK